jgi:hypothetical protein
VSVLVAVCLSLSVRTYREGQAPASEATPHAATYPEVAPSPTPGAEPASPAPPASPVSIGDLGKSPASQQTKKTTYDFENQVIEGELARPDAPNAASSQSKPITISEVTIVGDESIERYPNIEAPDTVAVGQEIAVQV